MDTSPSLIFPRVLLLEALVSNCYKLPPMVGLQAWPSFCSAFVAALEAVQEDLMKMVVNAHHIIHADEDLKNLVKVLTADDEVDYNVVLMIKEIKQFWKKLGAAHAGRGHTNVKASIFQFSQALDKHLLTFLQAKPYLSVFIEALNGYLPRPKQSWLKFLEAISMAADEKSVNRLGVMQDDEGSYRPISLSPAMQLQLFILGLICVKGLITQLTRAVPLEFSQPLPAAGRIAAYLADAQPAPSASLPDLAYVMETVFYATDRILPERRGTTMDAWSLEGLEYGTVKVGIPVKKQLRSVIGDLPTAVDDVVICSVENMRHNCSWFVQSINSYLTPQSFADAGSSVVPEVFIYVHGFATNFEQGIKRVAQLKHDLNFGGAASSYGWSSQGQLTVPDYFEDEKAAALTIPYLASFLKLCITQMKGQRLHILAHSMGNRSLIGALQLLYTEDGAGAWFSTGLHVKNLIFAAADETLPKLQEMFGHLKEVYEGSKYVGDLEEKKPHLSVYCAVDDKALALSQLVHNDRRVGITWTHLEEEGGGGEPAFTVKEDPETGYIDVIDARGVDADNVVNHNYYGDIAVVLRDMQLLLTSPGKDRAFLRAAAAATPAAAAHDDDAETIFNVEYGNAKFYSFSPALWAIQ